MNGSIVIPLYSTPLAPKNIVLEIRGAAIAPENPGDDVIQSAYRALQKAEANMTQVSPEIIQLREWLRIADPANKDIAQARAAKFPGPSVPSKEPLAQPKDSLNSLDASVAGAKTTQPVPNETAKPLPVPNVGPEGPPDYQGKPVPKAGAQSQVNTNEGGLAPAQAGTNQASTKDGAATAGEKK